MPDVSYHPVETLGFMEGQRKFPNAETRRFGANMVFYTWWLLEIGAATISTLALIALIVVLAKVDQQPQQTSVTGGTQVTINTVVAIISTIVRASLLAMVASALNQSPWNWFSKGADGRNGQPGQPLPDLNTFGDAAGSSLASLKLLYKTRFMHLASLGAALIVLSLAFDAFNQQVLGTQLRSVPNLDLSSNLTSGSIIPRTTSYLNQVPPQPPEEMAWFNTELFPQADAEAAILSGVLGVQNQQLTANCATGNCTWPTTPTMGICGSCDDARDLVLRNQTSQYSPITYLIPLNGSTVTSQTNVSILLPSEGYFDLATLVQPNTTSLGKQALTTTWILGVPASNVSQMNNLDGVLNSTLADSLIVAYSCSIYFCLQAYNASSTSGVFSSQSGPVWSEVAAMNDSSNNVYAYSKFVKVPETMNPGTTSNFTFDSLSRYYLQNGLMNGLGGSDAASLDDRSIIKSQIVTELWLSANTSDTMNAKIQQVTKSFSNLMRTKLVAPADERYAPTVSRDIVYVVVRWAWLAYPIVLVIAGHIFFVATVIQTQRRKIRPWKSQRLQLLVANVDNEIRDSAAGGLYRYNGLDDRLRRTMVRTEYDGQDNLAFRRVQPEGGKSR